jgi:hypothetical protein
MLAKKSPRPIRRSACTPYDIGSITLFPGAAGAEKYAAPAVAARFSRVNLPTVKAETGRLIRTFLDIFSLFPPLISQGAQALPTELPPKLDTR